MVVEQEAAARAAAYERIMADVQSMTIQLEAAKLRIQDGGRARLFCGVA